MARLGGFLSGASSARTASRGSPSGPMAGG
jgi:hypothetical protein